MQLPFMITVMLAYVDNIMVNLTLASSICNNANRVLLCILIHFYGNTLYAIPRVDKREEEREYHTQVQTLFEEY